MLKGAIRCYSDYGPLSGDKHNKDICKVSDSNSNKNSFSYRLRQCHNIECFLNDFHSLAFQTQMVPID